jgi:hypothetical protein
MRDDYPATWWSARPSSALLSVRVYTEVNARPQTIALGLGGPIEYISDEEGALRDKAGGDESRAWDLWKTKAMGK